MITLFVSGQMLTQFSKVDVEKSLDDFTGKFSFDVVDSDQFDIEKSDQFPIRVGEECKIYIDNELVISGFIDAISGDYSANSHMLHVVGRDKTSDLVDSHVGGDINFSSNITLEQVIKKTLSNLGITTLAVKNLVPDLKPFSQEDLDIVAAQPAKTAFEFIENYARKKQVMLTTDNTGTISIVRNSDQILEGKLINEFNNIQNNILSATFNYDNSKRYNKYIIRSQQNPVPLLFNGKPVSDSTTATDMSNQSGEATDNDIRSGRVFQKISESSSTKDQLKDRATWEGNIRRSRALVYSPMVQGFRINDVLWETNRLIQVSDFFAKIDSLMLVNKVKFSLSLNSGSTTTLELVEKDSYKLSLEYSKKDRKNKVAQKLIFDPRNPTT